MKPAFLTFAVLSCIASSAFADDDCVRLCKSGHIPAAYQAVIQRAYVQTVSQQVPWAPNCKASLSTPVESCESAGDRTILLRNSINAMFGLIDSQIHQSACGLVSTEIDAEYAFENSRTLGEFINEIMKRTEQNPALCP